MITNYELITGVRDYFASHFNDALVAVAEDLSISAFPPVSKFLSGAQDPKRFSSLNGMIFTIDKIAYSRDDGEYTVSFDVITTVEGSKPETVEADMAGYADTMFYFISENPTLGGMCFDALAESIEFFSPVPGASMMGLLITKLTLTVDGRAT